MLVRIFAGERTVLPTPSFLAFGGVRQFRRGLGLGSAGGSAQAQCLR
jgi:hypothetical protein